MNSSIVTSLCNRCLQQCAAQDDAQTPMGSLKSGECKKIAGFTACEDMAISRRLHDLGFHVGYPVELVRKAPFGGPMVFRVAETELMLRRKDVARVLVS